MKQSQKPYFLRYAPAVLLITVLVCLLSYFILDIPLALYFEQISPALRSTSRAISKLFSVEDQYLLWPIAYFVMRCIVKREGAANRCLLIAVSLPLTMILVELIKCLFGRARPELFFASHQFGLTFFSTADIFQSLPSGHASTIGVLCGAFACFYPKAKWPLLIAALLLAFVRVTLAQHYLSDVIAGVIIGFLMSQWIYSIMKRNKIIFSRR